MRSRSRRSTSAVDRILLPELAKLTRESFDLDSVINAAGELKCIGAIKRTLAAEFKEPSEEWVRYLGIRVYGGKKFTAKLGEQFAPLVEKAAHQFLTEQVNDRLTTAFGAGCVDRTASERDASGRAAGR